MIKLVKILSLSAISLYSYSAFSLQQCTKEWVAGSMNGPSIIFGVGVSANKDILVAKQEAQQRALHDLVGQIRTTVESTTKLTETEKTTGFDSFIKTSSNLNDIVGIKIVKEGADSDQGITFCIGVKLDVRKAYEIPEGKMKVLEKQIEEVNNALKYKKWLELIRLAKNVTVKIDSASADIALADIYKSFLNSPEKTWYEKFQILKTEIDLNVTKAKEKIVFVGPHGKYEIAFAEVESQLASQGYTYSNSMVQTEKIPVFIDIKQVGTIRKTKTVMGNTFISTMVITIRDGITKKELTSNKGASVVGTGISEEDALANIDRQIVSHILNALRLALPGVIEE